MKDEKIKEEMLKLFDEEGDYTEQELLFQTEMSEKGIKTESSSAFYAGLKTAERLAKIEVLEKVCKEIDSLELPRRAINAVTRIRDELKEDQ